MLLLYGVFGLSHLMDFLFFIFETIFISDLKLRVIFYLYSGSMG